MRDDEISKEEKETKERMKKVIEAEKRQKSLPFT